MKDQNTTNDLTFLREPLFEVTPSEGPKPLTAKEYVEQKNEGYKYLLGFIHDITKEISKESFAITEEPFISLSGDDIQDENISSVTVSKTNTVKDNRFGGYDMLLPYITIRSKDVDAYPLTYSFYNIERVRVTETEDVLEIILPVNHEQTTVLNWDINTTNPVSVLHNLIADKDACDIADALMHETVSIEITGLDLSDLLRPMQETAMAEHLSNVRTSIFNKNSLRKVEKTCMLNRPSLHSVIILFRGKDDVYTMTHNGVKKPFVPLTPHIVQNVRGLTDDQRVIELNSRIFVNTASKGWINLTELQPDDDMYKYVEKYITMSAIDKKRTPFRYGELSRKPKYKITTTEVPYIELPQAHKDVINNPHSHILGYIHPSAISDYEMPLLQPFTVRPGKEYKISIPYMLAYRLSFKDFLSEKDERAVYKDKGNIVIALSDLDKDDFNIVMNTLFGISITPESSLTLEQSIFSMYKTFFNNTFPIAELNHKDIVNAQKELETLKKSYILTKDKAELSIKSIINVDPIAHQRLGEEYTNVIESYFPITEFEDSINKVRANIESVYESLVNETLVSIDTHKEDLPDKYCSTMDGVISRFKQRYKEIKTMESKVTSRYKLLLDEEEFKKTTKSISDRIAELEQLDHKAKKIVQEDKAEKKAREDSWFGLIFSERNLRILIGAMIPMILGLIFA